MYSNLNKILKKIIIIFLLITITYSNFILIGSNIMKGLISYAKDETEISLKELLITNQELKTNKIYQINGEEKRVIQIELETGINSNEYPIKETNITLKTNIINKELEDVKVTSINTNSYTKGTWVVEDEEIKINLINEVEELKEKPEGLDKLLVTYIFQYEENEEIDYIEKAIKNVEIKTYEKAEASRTFEGGRYEKIELENNILNLTIENKDIHKTTIKEEKVAYKETINMDLGYRRDISKFTIEDIVNDIYKEETINEEVKVKYLKTIINKENLVNLLGEEGLLTMFDAKTGKTVAKITKEYLESLVQGEKTEQKIKDEGEETEELRAYITAGENSVEIEYAEEILKLQIKFENIAKQSENEIENAKFKIENEKEIINITNVEDIDYLLEKVKYTIEDEEEKEIESKITFKDTITKAILEVDNKEWKVGKINTVNYIITLDTKTDKTDLFVNPVFLLEMPKNVEVNTANSKFTIKNDNGAFTGKTVFVTTVLEKQYVAVILEGEQTQETIIDGNTQIELTLELNIKESAIQEEATTKLYYQNSGVTAYENAVGYDSTEIDILLVLKNEEQEEIVEQPTSQEEIVEEIKDKEEIEKDDNEENNNEEDIQESDNEEKFTVRFDTNSNDEIIREGEEFECLVYLNNLDTEVIKQLIVKEQIPEELEYIEANLYDYNSEKFDYTEKNNSLVEYNEDTKLLAITINNFESAIKTSEGNSLINGGYKLLKIKVKAKNLPKEVYNKKINNEFQIIKDGKEIIVNNYELEVSNAFLEININKIPNEVKFNNEIDFEITIKNLGLLKSEKSNISINFPKELNLTLSEEKYEKENVSLIETMLDSEYLKEIQILGGDTYILKIKAINCNNGNENKDITISGYFNEEKFEWQTILQLNESLDKSEEAGNKNNSDTSIAPDNKDNAETPIIPETPIASEDIEKSDNTNKPILSEEERTEGFDLNLKQYLNKITVTNKQGTTTYSYKNTNFAKVEIPAKYMNGSVVAFEYKIIVGNAGTIPGYARKIVDYLPEGLNFNSELNADWYIGEDGNLYSVALIDKLLNPGETEELTIILTKNMTNNNTGTITNIVEIYEASNDDNLEDINSIPGDKIEGQNDMSKVEVIVSVRTGEIIIYIILAMLVLTILIFGINKVRIITINKKEVL